MGNTQRRRRVAPPFRFVTLALTVEDQAALQALRRRFGLVSLYETIWTILRQRLLAEGLVPPEEPREEEGLPTVGASFLISQFEQNIAVAPPRSTPADQIEPAQLQKGS